MKFAWIKMKFKGIEIKFNPFKIRFKGIEFRFKGIEIQFAWIEMKGLNFRVSISCHQKSLRIAEKHFAKYPKRGASFVFR